MWVESLSVLGFRNLAKAELSLEPGINLAWGPNGAGKTNLLEALYAALVGRSCRTRSDREVIGFEAPIARTAAIIRDGPERRSFMTSIARDGAKRQRVDGSPVSPEHITMRPAVTVFLPDRLALVKGPPQVRRAHLDRFCAALWPARAEARRRYARALAQRNALLGRGGSVDAGSLDAWDVELATAGAELIATRSGAVSQLADEFAASCEALGLEGEARLAYAARSDASTPGELLREIGERRASDLARGRTTHGPHLDEIRLTLDGRQLRRYGSQGQQRLAVLALLFAERTALITASRTAPLMLLDDVTSELDRDRCRLLCARLEEDGQTLVTATEPEQLPARARAEVALRGGWAAASAQAEAA
jgi:DNA replication and repair protein RecF